MRVVVQRVINSSVEVDGKIVGKSDRGLMLLVGFTEGDSSKEIDWMVDKGLLDINGNILSISQFTLYGDASKGRRPSYIKALGGDKATLLYDEFNNKLRDKGIEVGTGIFGADMKVSLINDGPVTILLEK